MRLKEFINEMDKSQTPPGRDGSGSDPDSGKKEYYGKAEKPKDTVKKATDILNKAYKDTDKKKVKESIDDGRAYIKRLTRKRVDDSTEVRYHVIDGNGVTIKAFDDLNNAKAYLRANRDLLDKI
jgi:hypothetical protein